MRIFNSFGIPNITQCVFCRLYTRRYLFLQNKWNALSPPLPLSLKAIKKKNKWKCCTKVTQLFVVCLLTRVRSPSILCRQLAGEQGGTESKGKESCPSFLSSSVSGMHEDSKFPCADFTGDAFSHPAFINED